MTKGDICYKLSYTFIIFTIVCTYFLKSRRLGFGLWDKADTEKAIMLWGDSDVTRWIGGPFSFLQIYERLLTEIDNQKRYGVQYWPIYSLETHAHIGCCGLRPYKLHEGIYEIGFHIRSNQWGHGYGREATLSIIHHTFETIRANELIAGHHPQNEVSKKLLTRVGFKYIRDELYKPTGVMHPMYRFVRIRYPHWVNVK